MLDRLRERTAEIVAALGSADLAAPSELPGWSRVTIACHLRFGAEAFARLTRSALTGEPTEYYPGGREAVREQTLVPRSGESSADVVASLAAESDALHDLWASLDEAQWALVPPAEELGLPVARLALLRLTEVEVHGVDLGLGLGDWSDAFVREALPFRIGWLETRRSNHRAVDEAVEGSWLLDATDGGSWRISLRDGRVEVGPGADADAVLRGTSRDLLALLLGRPPLEPLATSGDVELAVAFERAFPGP